MSYNNTTFRQRLKPLSRHEFEGLAKEHHSGQKLCSASRWDQFIGMACRNFQAAKACEILSQI